MRFLSRVRDGFLSLFRRDRERNSSNPAHNIQSERATGNSEYRQRTGSSRQIAESTGIPIEDVRYAADLASSLGLDTLDVLYKIKKIQVNEGVPFLNGALIYLNNRSNAAARKMYGRNSLFF